MKQQKYFYERSNLLESEVNINFEELLWMNDSQTTERIDKMRRFIFLMNLLGQCVVSTIKNDFNCELRVHFQNTSNRIILERT